MYEGKSARGTSSTGRGRRRGSGSRRDGSTGGSPNPLLVRKKSVTNKLNSFVIDIVVGRLSQFGQHINDQQFDFQTAEKKTKWDG